MMYKCDECGQLFDDPVDGLDQVYCGNGIAEEVQFSACPYCGCESYTEQEECPCCGGWMPKGYRICGECMDDLKYMFNKFIMSLNEDARDQLDEWLDGHSIYDIEDL